MLAQANPQIGKAIAKLADISQDDEVRRIAESREKLRMDIAVTERVAEARGRTEERLIIAHNLLRVGRPASEIAEATGLTINQIHALMH
jgi:ABC-type Na+ transport system ATPase subunit NatA